MLFSSLVFLWIFLPVVLIIHQFVAPQYRNLVLLLASIIFYSWGEPRYIIIMLISISINYIFGIRIGKEKRITQKKLWLIVCITINLGILVFFKYYNFILQIINDISNDAKLSYLNILLPIGISFYTFQEISYIMDVYRDEVKPQYNILHLALYVTFFPQLIAGPIVKYHDINDQIVKRSVNVEKKSEGIRRFVYGLFKKVLVANVLASSVDAIYSMPVKQLSLVIAWGGAIMYSLQIYYDFSGYSDMAIGLGKIFGFDFLENFNYPYASQSVQEFWRRWHISMSTWFKEYLYIPLGGNRKGVTRTYLNLLIVFFITGLWHGANYTFIIWGLYHGIFSIIERLFLGNILKKNPLKILNRVYLMVVVLIGWVFFRADTLKDAIQYIGVMFGVGGGRTWNLREFVDIKTTIVILIGIIGCGIIPKSKSLNRILHKPFWACTQITVMTLLLLYCFSSLAAGAYNPFIYFRF